MKKIKSSPHEIEMEREKQTTISVTVLDKDCLAKCGQRSSLHHVIKCYTASELLTRRTHNDMRSKIEHHNTESHSQGT